MKLLNEEISRLEFAYSPLWEGLNSLLFAAYCEGLFCLAKLSQRNKKNREMAGKANEDWKLEENCYFSHYKNKCGFTTAYLCIRARTCVFLGTFP